MMYRVLSILAIASRAHYCARLIQHPLSPVHTQLTTTSRQSTVDFFVLSMTAEIQPKLSRFNLSSLGDLLPVRCTHSIDLFQVHQYSRGTPQTDWQSGGHRPKKLSCRRDCATLRVIGYFANYSVIRNNTRIEYGVCKSLLVFHWNYVCISYRFWDITWYWSKIALFHTPCIRRPR